MFYYPFPTNDINMICKKTKQNSFKDSTYKVKHFFKTLWLRGEWRKKFYYICSQSPITVTQIFHLFARLNQCISICRSSCKNSCIKNVSVLGFPDGPLVKSPPCNAWDTCSIPGTGRLYMP